MSLHREGSQLISQAIEQEEERQAPASSPAAPSRADTIALYWRGIALLDQALALQFTHAQWWVGIISLSLLFVVLSQIEVGFALFS